MRKLIKRLRQLQGQALSRDELLLKLGAAKKEAGKAYGLLMIKTPAKDEPVTPQTFRFSLDRKKLREARRRAARPVHRPVLDASNGRGS